MQVVLNQEKKGEYFVAVVEGRFLARMQDLLAAGVPVAGARTMVTGGNEYVWIDSIPGVQATFDEAQLALNLVADPKLLPMKTIDLWAGRSPQVAYPDNASAFFNYDIGYAGGNGSFPDGFFAQPSSAHATATSCSSTIPIARPTRRARRASGSTRASSTTTARRSHARSQATSASPPTRSAARCRWAA